MLFPEIGSPEFNQALNELTGTTLRPGNEIELLATGPASYERRWQLLDSARRSIDLATFSIINDDTSARLVEVVARKVKEGVAVRIVCDDGALYTTVSRPLVESMRRSGAQVVTYSSPFLSMSGATEAVLRGGAPALWRRSSRQFKRRFHEKYLVVDGENAILGGMNWGTKYALGGQLDTAWRDTDAWVTGPVIGDIEARFRNSWNCYVAAGEKGAADRIPERPAPEPSGASTVRYIGHKPYDEERLPLTDALLYVIRCAKRSIFWGCHGVRPPRVIAEALAAAVERGVEVRLITNSEKSSRSLMGRGLLG